MRRPRRSALPVLALLLGPAASAQAPSSVDTSPAPPPVAPYPIFADATDEVGGAATDFADPGSGRGQAIVDVVGPDPSDPTNPSKVGPPDGILDLVQVNSNSPALPLSAAPGEEITPAVGDEQFPCVVYRGAADGSLTDVTDAMVPPGSDGFDLRYPCGSPWGVVAGDFDDDGDMDLAFPCGGFNFDSPNTFLRNGGDGTFTNASAEVGFAGSRATFAMTAVDHDRDGELDVYEVNSSAVLPTFYQGNPNPDARDRLWRNDGSAFEDRAAEAEVDLAGNGFSATAADLDRDGWPDLALSCFRQFNKVYYNEGDGSFSFMTPAGSPHDFALDDLPPDHGFPGTVDFAEVPPGFDGLLPMLGVWSMPVEARDLNQDGWIDLMFHSWSSQLADADPFSAEGGWFLPFDESRVYLNRGDQDGDGAGEGLFREAAEELGIAHVGGAMGARAMDVNGDGFDDVYVGGGGPQIDKHLEEDYLYVQEPSAWPADFQADPDQPLERVFYEVGALAGTYSNVEMSHGVSALSGPTGRLDAAVGNGGPALFGDGQANVYYRHDRNSDGSTVRFLEVALEPQQSAPGAYGARVQVVRDGAEGPGRVLVRERRSGAVFASHDDAPERFAIGDGGALFTGVEWPSGVRSGRLLWPDQADVDSLAMVEPTLSVALDLAPGSAGGVDLSLEIVETGAAPSAGGVYLLSLHPTGVPGLFTPLVLLEVAPAVVFDPGAPFVVEAGAAALPAGLYAVLVLGPGTGDVVGADAAWHDPAALGASAPPEPGTLAACEAGIGAKSAEQVPRTHVAPAKDVVLRSRRIEVAPDRIPLEWQSVDTTGTGSLELPSGAALRWEDGLVRFAPAHVGGSDLSFQSGAPVIVAGRAMTCCDGVAPELGTIVRFGPVDGVVTVDGIDYTPGGIRVR